MTILKLSSKKCGSGTGITVAGYGPININCVVTTHAVMRNHFSFLQADNNAKPMQVVLVHREKQFFHGKHIDVDGVMIYFVVRVVIV